MSPLRDPLTGAQREAKLSMMLSPATAALVAAARAWSPLSDAEAARLADAFEALADQFDFIRCKFQGESLRDPRLTASKGLLLPQTAAA